MQRVTRNKFLALLLAISMIVSLVLPAAAADEGGALEIAPISAPIATPYVTVPAHWAGETLADWVTRGLLTGDENGDLLPDAPITRGSFMALVNRLYGYETAAEDLSAYADIDPTAWYYEHVAIAVGAGYIVGDGVNIRPNAPISRNEAVSIVARIAGMDADAAADMDVLANVGDFDDLPTWVYPHLSFTVAEGYISGYEGRFNGANNITRAEAVVLLNRVFSGERNFGFPGTYGGTTEAIMDASKVTVSSEDVVLKHVNIVGSLTIAASVGDGEVTVEDVKVGGKMLVLGGGANSVYLVRVTVVDSLGVYKEYVRVVIVDDSDIGNVELYAAAVLNTEEYTGEGTISVDIKEVPEGEAVELVGNFESVTNNVPNLELNITGSVEKLVVEAPTSVKGTAEIKTAEVSEAAGEGTSFEQKPTEVTGGGADKVTVVEETPKTPSNVDPNPNPTPSTPSYSITGSIADTSGDKSSTPASLVGAFHAHGYFGSEDDDAWENTLTSDKYVADFTLGYSFSNAPARKVVLAFKLTGGTGYLLCADDPWTDEHNVTTYYLWDVLNNKNYPPAEGSHGDALGTALALYDGYMGSTVGRNISGSGSKSDQLMKFFATTAGDYTLTVDLIDFTDPSNVVVLATKAVTITVYDEAGDDSAVTSGVSGLENTEYATKALAEAAIRALATTGTYDDNDIVWGSDDTANVATVTKNAGGTVTFTFQKVAEVNDAARTAKRNAVDSHVSSNYTESDYTSASWDTFEAAITTIKNTTITALDTFTAITDFDVSAAVDTAAAALVPTATVTTAAQLTAALANVNIPAITVSGAIGSASAYTTYTVARPVTIQGTNVATDKVFGTFTVTADGVTFDKLFIQNEGAADGGEKRNAINFYGDTITVTNCSFNLGGDELGNGISIFPKSTKTVDYTITGNIFNGFDNQSDIYQSSGVVITSNWDVGTNKPFFGLSVPTMSGTATISEEQELAIINNTYTGCSVDYAHGKYGAGNHILCTSVTNSTNLRLGYAHSSAGGTYYIKGAVNRTTADDPDDITLDANSKLIILSGGSLTIGSGVTLTVNGTLTVEDTATLTVTGTINGTGNVKVAKESGKAYKVTYNSGTTYSYSNASGALGVIGTSANLTEVGESSGIGYITIPADQYKTAEISEYTAQEQAQNAILAVAKANEVAQGSVKGTDSVESTLNNINNATATTFYTNGVLTKANFALALEVDEGDISDDLLLVYQTIVYASTKTTSWETLAADLAAPKVTITAKNEYNSENPGGVIYTVPANSLVTEDAAYSPNAVTVTVTANMPNYDNGNPYTTGSASAVSAGTNILYGGFDADFSGPHWGNPPTALPYYLNGSTISNTSGGTEISRVVTLSKRIKSTDGTSWDGYTYSLTANKAGEGVTYVWKNTSNQALHQFPVLRMYAAVAAVKGNNEAFLSAAGTDSRYVQLYFDGTNTIIGYSVVQINVVAASP